MLNIAFTRYQLTTNKLVASDVTAAGIVDGAGLFSKLENGALVVSNGEVAADNVFAGIAFSQYRAQTATNAVEEFKAPANGGSIVLAHQPVGAISTVFASMDGEQAAVVAAEPAAGEIQLVGNTMTFHADDAGKSVYVCYKYNLTVAEIESIPFMGDGVPGAAVSAQTGTVSVGQKGEFYTDQFDTSVDWNSDAEDIQLIDGGIFSRGQETGVKVNAVVCHVPTAELPFLGIELK